MIDWQHEMKQFNARNEGAFPKFHRPEEMLSYLYGYFRSINKVAQAFHIVGYTAVRNALVKQGMKIQGKGRVKGQLIDTWG